MKKPSVPSLKTKEKSKKMTQQKMKEKSRKNNSPTAPAEVISQASETDDEDENEDEDFNLEDVVPVDDEDDLETGDWNLPVAKSSSELLNVPPGRVDPHLTEPLKIYLKEVARYDLLTPEEENRLTQELAATGDIEVAKRLVKANLRLVVKIALEYRHAYQNVLDLIQEGNIGLMKAVSKFDPGKGAKLSYYASWWIRSYILKFILDNFRLVKIGTTREQKKLFYNLLKEKERLTSQGIRPETKLLSQNLGVSEKNVEMMEMRLGLGGTETSLDRPVGDESSGGRVTTFAETLVTEEPSIEERLADLQGLDILKDKLKDFVSGLKPRDREIFEKRLLSEIPPSLQSIADEYGVSRERIRQVEERLVNKLKEYMSEFIR